ncbi:MAG: hypothetical protein HRT81_00145 [Henriciella sp.]|nr:hypothetical protein [Henriciella sp.]
MGIIRSSHTLSGVWSGRYWVSETDTEGVQFSAWLSLENGSLTGSILEPSLFGLCEHTENESTIRGHVTDDEVVFLKTYKGVDHEPGYYEGELSECRQRILGRWYFGWPDEMSGRFEMTLKSANNAAATPPSESASSLK